MALLGVVVIACIGTRAVGKDVCRPDISVSSVRFSEARSLQRAWSASVQVDASRCTATAGRFNINFIRLKLNAPDLPFVERFTWKSGDFEVAVDFWEDEAVLEYAVGDIASCPCRE
jgi:hypothetical protein